ncbi:hypothetical protein AAFC00_004447 [Neodothiora populina]|uniref:Asl1-like glycosyl hydrolase catalytic domain-containing protein n=1 Tax=Neodothiora populina TaxID=2781224 RepID=A0ABR3P203_9PEZI
MLGLALTSLAFAAVASASTSDKRGLVYVSSSDNSKDDKIWSGEGSDLTWYYNYQAFPTTVYIASQLEFVPQLWGGPADPENDRSFYDAVKNLITDHMNITHVLGFNEPDATESGGSGVSPQDAATVWKRQFEPLKRDYGVLLGAPAVTGGPSGHQWLQDFFTACSAISGNTSCEVDFIPVHWYGNFEGLSSHVSQVNSTYANVSDIWVTEFACANCSQFDSQAFFNDSTSWLDEQDFVGRYSYFGAFRSDISNVGPNAAFLNPKGKLTSIGSWYLGHSTAGAAASGSPINFAKFAGWGIVVAMSMAMTSFL